MYGGVIKNVYVPFSTGKWRLKDTTEQTRKKYEDYYESIKLRDKMSSIFLQYFKYGNVYVYIMENGNIVTLPVHKCRISNITMNGEPLVEFNVSSIRDDFVESGVKADKSFIDDALLEERLKGFPPEVADALKKNQEYAQLNPENTHVLQGLKEDWQRYSIPIIASFLGALSKKALIRQYEDALLNLGLRTFFHVTYGDPDNNADLMPDQNQLNQVRRIFSKAMSGNPLAVTNNWCKSSVIQADTRFLYEWDKYNEVNRELLSAGGISSVIVSGSSAEGSSFATAQISMQTAIARIKYAQDSFCELMNKINQRLNGRGTGGVTRNASKNVPKFVFVPTDLNGNKAFQETCLKLWQQGVVSTETMLDNHGYDLKQEFERRENENNDGIEAVMYKPGTSPSGETQEEDGTEKKKGRKPLNDEERNSPEGDAATGKQPKPSNPDPGTEPEVT